METENKGMTLAEYVANLQTDKQEYDEVNNATDDYLDAEVPEVVELDNPAEQGDDKINIVETLGTNEMAEVFLGVYKTALNTFIRAFSQGYVNTKEIEVSSEDLATIRIPLRSYLKIKKIDVSPGAALTMAVLAVTAPKILMLRNAKKQAIKELKENEQASDV